MTELLMAFMILSTYDVGPAAGNRFSLEVEKTGVLKGKKHTFSFPKYSGKVQYDEASPEKSTVEFTLDGASMVNEDTWVKDSDKQKILAWGLDKMIEVDKHPQIRFVSERVEKKEESFQVTGNLTMRGVSRPALLSVTKTASGNALTWDGRSVVNMKDWGMKPPSAALGTVGTKPEMTVQFHFITRTK